MMCSWFSQYFASSLWFLQVLFDFSQQKNVTLRYIYCLITMCFCNWLYFTFCSYLNLIFCRFYCVLVALMFGLILLLSPMPPLLLAKSCCSPLLDGVKTFTLKVSKTFCLNWAYKFLLLLFLLSPSIAFPLEKIVSSINACSTIFRSRSTCKLQKRKKISLDRFLCNIELGLFLMTIFR